MQNRPNRVPSLDDRPYKVRRWSRDVLVATALTLAAVIILGLTFLTERMRDPQPTTTTAEINRN